MYKNIISSTERICRSCELVKSLNEFNKSHKGSQGRQSRCRNCCSLDSHRRNQSNKDHRRSIKLKNRYGITLIDYKFMEKSQEYCCKICDQEFEEDIMHVDHCHSTGKVRGLLCPMCNKGLGHFKDDILRMKRAVEYLKENG